jgi:hypothetical protein
MVMVRAAHWHNLLDGLGLGLPFFLVHDLGLLLTQAAGAGVQIAARERSLRIAVDRGALKLDAPTQKKMQGYGDLLVDLARSRIRRSSPRIT